MSNVPFKKPATPDGYMKATGAGTDGDPYVVEQTISLPAGASTAANQTALIGHVDGIEGLLATMDADTSSMATDLDTLAGAVSGTEMQVDVLSLPALPDTAAGDLAAIRALTESVDPVPVVTPDILIEVTPVLDTSAYTSGDTLFGATEIVNAARAEGAPVLLSSLALVDKDDQKQAMTLYFFDRTVTFGTVNAAPGISDTDAGYYMGHVDIASEDWSDLGGVAVATVTGIALQMQPYATSLYVAATTGGAPTHTASGLVCKFGLLRS